MSETIGAEWSPIDMISKAWERLLPHLLIMVGITFACGVIQTGLGFVLGFVEGIIGAVAQEFAASRGGDEAHLLAAIVRLLLVLGRTCITFPLTMLVAGASTRLALNVARGEAPDLGAFSFALGRLLPLIGASLLLGIGMFFGILALVIPGIILALGTQFYVMVLMDTELGPIDALSYSWRIASAHLLNLLFYGVVIGVIGLVALCGTCGVALLVVQPLALVAHAMIYVHLSGRQQDLLPDPVL